MFGTHIYSDHYTGVRPLIPVTATAITTGNGLANGALAWNVSTGPAAAGNYCKLIVSRFQIYNAEAGPMIVTIADGTLAGAVNLAVFTVAAGATITIEGHYEFNTGVVIFQAAGFANGVRINLLEAGETS